LVWLALPWLITTAHLIPAELHQIVIFAVNIMPPVKPGLFNLANPDTIATWIAPTLQEELALKFLPVLLPLSPILTANKSEILALQPQTAELPSVQMVNALLLPMVEFAPKTVNAIKDLFALMENALLLLLTEELALAIPNVLTDNCVLKLTQLLLFVPTEIVRLPVP